MRAEGTLRQIPHLEKSFAGYDAEKYSLAFLIKVEANEETFEKWKEDAFAVALAAVLKRNYQEEDPKKVEDILDVQLAIKELIRTAGIEDSVDKFMLNLIELA